MIVTEKIVSKIKLTRPHTFQ